MKFRLVATVGLVAIGAASITAQAADEAIEKAVKARQALMTINSFNLGPLGAMAKGEMDYDAGTAATYANNLAVLANMNTGAMWPQGSDTEALGEDKTKALPAAWAANSKIMEKHEAWVEATNQLANVAGDGLDTMKPAVAEVGKSCGGCHDLYRAEKK